MLRLPGLGHRRLVAALAAAGSIQALASASASRLAAWGLPPDTRRALDEPADPARLAADRAWLECPGQRLLTFDDPAYPARLRQLADPPAALWLRGRAELLAEPQLAIVGSRNPSHDGRDIAEAFAAHLSRAGLVITSGLAEGIDGAAHRGALQAGGDTVAVLGCGPDVVYPAVNRALAEDIATRGLLVSEHPPGTPPLRHHFPARNRLIAALTLGVLVVEAATRSGSLITARLAGDLGREVFAIPGSIHNPMARGCHQLIREGAKLVESGEDVLSELAGALGAWLRPASPEVIVAAAAELHAAPTPAPDAPDPEYRKLLSAMEFAPLTIDQLAARTGLTPGALSSMLLILELQGAVESRPGGRFAASRNAPRKRS